MPTRPHRRPAPFRAAAVLAAAVLTVPALASLPAPARADWVERFAADPLGGTGPNVFVAEGDTASRFAFVADEPSRFPGDRPGTLRVLYDTRLPTARISAPFGAALSLDADFSFGAILTIRSEGFFASPDGFSQIAFGLWNAATTGMNRTGFPSDAYDLVELDYFPNVTAFGGPFVSPSVFGGNVGDNAFFNFAFQSAETVLPHDAPLLIEGRYTAATRSLQVTVSRHASGVVFARLPQATVTVDLSRISPTFIVDVAGIAGYFEGFESIRAAVDYDLLYVGALPAPFGVVARTRRPVGR
jgi:hypothetical protein